MTAQTRQADTQTAQSNNPAARKPWEPKSTDIRESVAKYSRFVSAMKIVLPSTAAFLFALVLILPQLRDDPDQFSADIIPAQGGTGDTRSLVNARYVGTDDSGQPFSVTADSVRESSDAPDEIDLIAPQADISLNDGTWLVVGAETGQYHRQDQVLQLEGAVNLFQDQGYELHSDAVTVLLEEGRATSTVSTRSQGPFGQLESNGFELEDKGKTVFFTGPARLLLNPGSVGSEAP